MDKPVLLIDGDIGLYRSCCPKQVNKVVVEEDTFELAKSKFDYWMSMVFRNCNSNLYYAFITGRDNFRKAIGVTKPYKGNRTGERPQHLPELQEYAIKRYKFIRTIGAESDDYCGTYNTILKEKGTPTIIVTSDKDLKTLVGRFYNPNKQEFDEVNYDQSIYNLCYQLIVGDTTDNIPGLKGKGIDYATRQLAGYGSFQLINKVKELFNNDTLFEEQYNLVKILDSTESYKKMTGMDFIIQNPIMFTNKKLLNNDKFSEQEELNNNLYSSATPLF